MKRLFLLLTIAIFSLGTTVAEVPRGYKIFTKEGTEISYRQMLEEMTKYDVLCFGEQHDNPIAHWLELRVVQDLYELKGGAVQVGLEMIERDRQIVLDEYMAGIISKDRFEVEGKLWANHSTDYAAIIEWAKQNEIATIGTNVPRRYANAVSHNGLDVLKELSDEAKQWIAPLPIEIEEGNKSIFMAMMSMQNGGEEDTMARVQLLQAAQSLKDATMAWTIVKHRLPDHLFIHYNGTLHSNNNKGIIYYLTQYAPKLKSITISTVRQKCIDILEDKSVGEADYIIVTTSDFPTSY